MKFIQVPDSKHILTDVLGTSLPLGTVPVLVRISSGNVVWVKSAAKNAHGPVNLDESDIADSTAK